MYCSRNWAVPPNVGQGSGCVGSHLLPVGDAYSGSEKHDVCGLQTCRPEDITELDDTMAGWKNWACFACDLPRALQHLVPACWCTCSWTCGVNIGTCEPVNADGHVDKHILGEPTADSAGGGVSCTHSGARPACLPGTAGFVLSMRLWGAPTSGTVFGDSTSESLKGISCAVCALPALLAWTAGLQSMRISPVWVDLDVGSFVGEFCPSTSRASFGELICDLQGGLTCV